MIHTEALTRTFRSGKETVRAVEGIDLDVGAGELVALLGPNGAGKSTTLRMLTSLLRPSSGTATVAGVEVSADPAGVRRRIGYIGQKDGAGHSYRVGDELLMQGRFHGLGRAEAASRGTELLTSLDLAGMERRKVSTLSGGQKRRLDIAMGLIHRPPLLFLDEPSTGMDPQNRANLWEHLLRLRERHGTTIVLTTHYLEEADAQAERVVVIDHGRIIADDTAENLKAEQAGDRIRLGVAAADAGRCAEVVARLGGSVEQQVHQHPADQHPAHQHPAHQHPAHQNPDGPDGRDPSGRVAGPEEVVLVLRVEQGRRTLPRLLLTLDAEGIEVLEASVRRPTLDDVFLHLTGRSLREGAPARHPSTHQEVPAA